MEMKYVVTQTFDEDEQEDMFIFPRHFDHDVFSEVLSYIKTGGERWERKIRKPISAGFTDGICCYGRSETLDLDSRPCDSDLLAMGGRKID